MYIYIHHHIYIYIYICHSAIQFTAIMQFSSMRRFNSIQLNSVQFDDSIQYGRAEPLKGSAPPAPNWIESSNWLGLSQRCCGTFNMTKGRLACGMFCSVSGKRVQQGSRWTTTNIISYICINIYIYIYIIYIYIIRRFNSPQSCNSVQYDDSIRSNSIQSNSTIQFNTGEPSH